MDISKHTTSSNLERYAFYWLLALLVFSAGALFLGARPPITLILGYSSLVFSVLKLMWIISGVAAVYLTYSWVQNKKRVFGGTEKKDMAAFWFMILCGYNLGIMGLMGMNIYFQIAMGYFVYIITGIAALVFAGYLYKRWLDCGQRLFPGTPIPKNDPDAEGVKRTEPGQVY